MTEYKGIEILSICGGYQYRLFGILYMQESIEACKYEIDCAHDWFMSEEVAY